MSALRTQLTRAEEPPEGGSRPGAMIVDRAAIEAGLA
jgi:hypothetical protein